MSQERYFPFYTRSGEHFLAVENREGATAAHAVSAPLRSPNLRSFLLLIMTLAPYRVSSAASPWAHLETWQVGRLAVWTVPVPSILMSDSSVDHGFSHKLGPGCTTSLRNPGLRQPPPMEPNSCSSGGRGALPVPFVRLQSILSVWNIAWLVKGLWIIKNEGRSQDEICSPSDILGPCPLGVISCFFHEPCT